jgi:hypothetical protein
MASIQRTGAETTIGMEELAPSPLRFLAFRRLHDDLNPDEVRIGRHRSAVGYGVGNIAGAFGR